MMLNHLWLSLWATSYITLANQSEDAVMWHILMIVPILIIIPALCGIVRVSARLVGLTTFDYDSFGKVIEIVEDVDRLKRLLRDKIISTVEAVEHSKRRQKDFVRQLFNAFDLDKSGDIALVEFRKFVRIFDVKCSNTKLKMLFNAFDESKDGVISLDELERFIFDDDGSNELEVFGLKRTLTHQISESGEKSFQQNNDMDISKYINAHK
eukprot:CAMPEP_0182432400 /NCGR_PEP_ID=MMETSP1167-20130531/56058_1 /TAXON_ID=2988 /ORGANISM="Mallomonas Sp, Strain CCMP3275" /LENGTH=209 /DNA_ID=CAMNT_0024619861 /DNA_START=554 /DNA_END=1183 /DNA_ORIENTATION=+